MAQTCRICCSKLGAADYSGLAPSISSTSDILDLPLSVYVCRNCAHAQSDELPDLQDYYDKTYRISMMSDGHDQLYEIVDGAQIFRTDKQAQMVLSKFDLPSGARILDFGAAKAVTLQKICKERDDLVPHVFDVSQDYVDHWSSWLAENHTATYNLPQQWDNYFDCITAHFVLEHVANPVALLVDLRRLTKSGGVLFLSVPNVFANSGDLLVADHVNHFSRTSLELALGKAGFRILEIDEMVFQGAFVVTAIADVANEHLSVSETQSKKSATDLLKQTKYWTELVQKLDQEAAVYQGRKIAVYGAGFYGSLLFSRLKGTLDIHCFVDRNPHVSGRTHLSVPVVEPSLMDNEIDLVFAGLNPAKAKQILSAVPEWQNRNVEIVFLD